MNKLGERKRTNANAKGNKIGQTEIEEKERITQKREFMALMRLYIIK